MNAMKTAISIVSVAGLALSFAVLPSAAKTAESSLTNAANHADRIQIAQKAPEASKQKSDKKAKAKTAAKPKTAKKSVCTDLDQDNCTDNNLCRWVAAKAKGKDSKGKATPAVAAYCQRAPLTKASKKKPAAAKKASAPKKSN